MIDSQLVDIADDHEYRTGKRAEGIIFSIRTFAIKATAGFGGLVGGLGLQYINFPDNASAATLTSESINGLLFMTGPLYWLIVFAGMLFMGMYQLNEKRHGEIMVELEMRRAARSNNAPSDQDTTSPAGESGDLSIADRIDSMNNRIDR